MDSLVVAAAQFLPFLIPLAGLVVWLFLPRADQLALAAQALVGLVVALVLIQAAAALHVDPRPFVVDPTLRPLFPHPADNGFPSDHTTLTATVAMLVMLYRRRVGAALLLGSILTGAARVAANVHHTQDIAAGVVIAALAVGASALLWRWIRPRLPRPLLERVGASTGQG